MASSRRLAAIMFTDMVGFTSRTQTDERGTLALLREQEEVVRPILANHHGRAVKSTGDGFLVEFPSALEAMECAVAIQERLHERNEGARGAPIELRIGIHLGDVEQRGDDIFGDAVNIASRVQPVADPGGVAVSQQVFDQVRNKTALSLERLEPRTLKGLQFPMDVYRVALPWNAAPAASVSAAEPGRIAVLPFSNISPDPSDAYFSDGLTEEVITVLSEIGELRVIARTSVEAYKRAPKPIPQVGVELGVSWVLEGSVRKAGTRLRITAQLIDVRTQEHIWASTYDRELDDVFAVQAEMAKRVAEALKIKLLAREEARLTRRTPPRADSYLEYLQGRASMRGATEAELKGALAHFERAVELDGRNAAAHAGLADVHTLLGGMYRHLPDREWRAAARREAERAIELDPELAEARTTRGLGRYLEDDFAAAEEEFRRAIALNPSYAGAHQWYADLLADLGRPEEALREFSLARQLDPLSALVLAEESSLLTDLRRLDDAAAAIEKLGEIDGHGLLYADRRAGLALVRGDFEDVRRQLGRLAEFLPGRPELLGAEALLAARSGQPDRARELIRSIEGLDPTRRPDSLIARVYAHLGDVDSCFRWLEISRVDSRFPPRSWRYDPDVAEIRADPRFGALLKRMRLA